MAPHFKSLQTRILVLIAACFLPGFVIFTLVTVVGHDKELRDVHDKVHRLAAMGNTWANEVLADTERLLKVLSLSSDISGTDGGQCSDKLRQIWQASPGYNNIGRVNPDGSVACSAIATPAGYSIADADFFRQALATKALAISTYRIGKITHKALITMALPLLGQDGTVESVLVAGIELKSLSERLAKLPVPAGTVTTVVDQNGVVLARYPVDEAWIGRAMPELADIRRLLAGSPSGAELSDAEGVDRLFAVAPFGPAADGASLIIGVPAAVAFALSNWLAVGAGAAALLSVLLVLCGGWFGSRIFVLRGIGAAFAASRRISGGDLSVRIGPINGASEIVDLARSLDEMAGTLLASQTRLQKSEERLTLALEAAEEGLWDWDVPSGRIHWSPRIAEMLGYAPGDLEPHMSTWRRLIHPEDLPAVERGIADQLAGHTALYESEYRILTKSGGWKWVLNRGRPIERDADGRPTRIIGTRTDVTERKAAEEELRSARLAAEAAARAKSEFLATMSHELRTPLNAVIGLSVLLVEGRVGRLSGKQQEFMNEILGSGRHLLEIINDLLDLSRIEAGGMKLETATFDINALAESCAKAIEGGAHAKGVALAVRLEPGGPWALAGDPTRIRQVLLNLLSNAVKFTPAGRIELTVARRAAGDGRFRLRVAVADTGIGIPADKMPLLFQRFSQIDRSDSRRYGGTGLGLAISKHLVEMMGGTIGVESTPGRGSLFWFELVLADAGPATSGGPLMPVSLAAAGRR